MSRIIGLPTAPIRILTFGPESRGQGRGRNDKDRVGVGGQQYEVVIGAERGRRQLVNLVVGLEKRDPSEGEQIGGQVEADDAGLEDQGQNSAALRGREGLNLVVGLDQLGEGEDPVLLLPLHYVGPNGIGGDAFIFTFSFLVSC